MANNYTLRYLPIAVDDLISIFDWIANDSPAHAASFIKKGLRVVVWGILYLFEHTGEDFQSEVFLVT